MGKISAVVIGLLLSGLLCLHVAHTQTLLLLGAGKGASVVASAPYMGPGDIVAGATAWWGLRCYSSTYVGNVARVKSPSDALTTTITCATGGVLGTTGTALATTCATSCTVDILYDQSGALACTGSTACDAVQTMEAIRPRYVTSCLGARACMNFYTGVGASNLLTPVLTSAVNQTYVISYVANRVSTSGYNALFESSGSTVIVGFGNASDVALSFAGTFTSAAATDADFHAIQATLAGASGELYVDGSGTTVAAGANAVTTASGVYIGGDMFNFIGKAMEVGLWPSAFSGGNKSGMNTNQHAYWGF